MSLSYYMITLPNDELANIYANIYSFSSNVKQVVCDLVISVLVRTTMSMKLEVFDPQVDGRELASQIDTRRYGA